MPSPFNSNPDGPQNEARLGSEELITVENAELYCEMCFYPSQNGLYHEASKRLFWTCENSECFHNNAVKDIEL